MLLLWKGIQGRSFHYYEGDKCRLLRATNNKTTIPSGMFQNVEKREENHHDKTALSHTHSLRIIPPSSTSPIWTPLTKTT